MASFFVFNFILCKFSLSLQCDEKSLKKIFKIN